MSLFEDAMAVAVQLPQGERVRLAQALGVVAAAPARGNSLPLTQFAPRPDPVAWRKAETGHAVLATGGGTARVAPGPAALAGMWSHHADRRAVQELPEGFPEVSRLPRNTPVVVHIDACFDLALGVEAALRFFEAPLVEIRLATAGYLALLAACESQDEIERARSFVQPYAVLSLGPMASSRAVELILAQGLSDGLQPLDALTAATALAHEIPLVARNPSSFINIAGLTVCAPYRD